MRGHDQGRASTSAASADASDSGEGLLDAAGSETESDEVVLHPHLLVPEQPRASRGKAAAATPSRPTTRAFVCAGGSPPAGPRPLRRFTRSEDEALTRLRRAHPRWRFERILSREPQSFPGRSVAELKLRWQQILRGTADPPLPDASPSHPPPAAAAQSPQLRTEAAVSKAEVEVVRWSAEEDELLLGKGQRSFAQLLEAHRRVFHPAHRSVAALEQRFHDLRMNGLEAHVRAHLRSHSSPNSSPPPAAPTIPTTPTPASPADPMLLATSGGGAAVGMKRGRGRPRKYPRPEEDDRAGKSEKSGTEPKRRKLNRFEGGLVYNGPVTNAFVEPPRTSSIPTPSCRLLPAQRGRARTRLAPDESDEDTSDEAYAQRHERAAADLRQRVHREFPRARPTEIRV